jgi:hypothetical protein
VRDASLLRNMRHAHYRWHVQSRFHYAGRLVCWTGAMPASEYSSSTHSSGA